MKPIRTPVDLASYEQFFAKSRLANRVVRRRRRADKFWQLRKGIRLLLGGRFVGILLDLMADLAEEEYLNEQQ
ncbi:hypothetical protein [Spirosoma oryzicola]|uniref:hypothetical protein n=1 Tax=Spirosoma oryzicola TaxID=2898794 RepID=UPI001E6474A1|nr:hypothetical protein [Spirosoma oryzicola]UHG93355.1 hypothetical protein LQ777_10730 [Spirosoma oryzicola]